MSAIEVAHERLHKKNERLSTMVDKFKSRGANLTRAAVHGGEVILGAAIAGAIAGQHVAKEGDKHAGPTIAGMPADLTVGAALTIIGGTNAFGETWSPHVGALGLGFLAGFGAEWGYHRGQQRAKQGTWFAKHDQKSLGGGTKASGEATSSQMAESLLAARRGANAGG